MKKIFLSLILTICVADFCNAQFALYKGDASFELTGGVAAFYNKRFYQPGDDTHDKDRFGIDYAFLEFKMRKGTHWRGVLKTEFIDANAGVTFNQNLMLKKVYIQYETAHTGTSLKFGYDKIPYSKLGNESNFHSPFQNKNEVTNGNNFGLRDVGLILGEECWKQRIQIALGAYTGLGENSLMGDNDASGNFEYSARIQIAYPSNPDQDEVDEHNMPLPTFQLGLNALYANKVTDGGGDYNYEIFNGKKQAEGFDASFYYKGFCVIVESHFISFYPNDTTRLLHYITDHFNGGGIVAEATYYCKKIHSIIGVRYDQYNPNDLIVNDQRTTVTPVFNFRFPNSSAIMKLQYAYRFSSINGGTPWKDNELRVGFTYAF